MSQLTPEIAGGLYKLALLQRYETQADKAKIEEALDKIRMNERQATDSVGEARRNIDLVCKDIPLGHYEAEYQAAKAQLDAAKEFDGAGE